MFFDDLKRIPEIAKKVDCAVFVVPTEQISKVQIKDKKAITFTLEPLEGKKDISIEQVKELLADINTKETSERYIIIRPADKLNEASGNALLKSLEEPHAHYHFLLITGNPSDIMPTILSRSAIYIYKTVNMIDQPPAEKAAVVEDAKKLIAATPKTLIEIAEKVTKSKDSARDKALTLLSVAIELCYKSYFKTKNPIFLKKLPKFIAAYTSINNNGHIKIHLIADLL